SFEQLPSVSFIDTFYVFDNNDIEGTKWVKAGESIVYFNTTPSKASLLNLNYEYFKQVVSRNGAKKHIYEDKYFYRFDIEELIIKDGLIITNIFWYSFFDIKTFDFIIDNHKVDNLELGTYKNDGINYLTFKMLGDYINLDNKKSITLYFE